MNILSRSMPPGDSTFLHRKYIEALIDQVNVLTRNISGVQAAIGGRGLYAGAGSPEGIVAAGPGSIYFDTTNPLAPVQYVKGSGTGTTGWL
jgi:hypothetical protein